MENKELYRMDLGDKKIEDIAVDGKITIKYEGGEISFEDYHERDCCERVYADYDQAGYLREVIGKNAGEIIVKGVEDMGFLLCVADKKVFVPCYNAQNGYYSTALTLKVKNGATTTDVDISDFVEDNID